MKAHFARMAEYNAWANARIYAEARKLPDESYRRNVGAFFRDDWRAAQRRAVEAACADEGMHVWVATAEPTTAGFVALKLHPEDRMGEIYMIAVDPAFQRRGIAAALRSHAVDWFKSAGMSIAMVETGADPGHAPARRAYEAAGFSLLPVARYFKEL